MTSHNAGCLIFDGTCAGSYCNNAHKCLLSDPRSWTLDTWTRSTQDPSSYDLRKNFQPIIRFAVVTSLNETKNKNLTALEKITNDIRCEGGVNNGQHKQCLGFSSIDDELRMSILRIRQ